MKQLTNENGYLTVESAILMPSILFLVCLFVGFFCISFKMGAFQALVNHERLIAELGAQRYYKIEQIEDDSTTLTVKQNKQSKFDDLERNQQDYEAKLSAPFYKDSVVVRAHTDEWNLPYVYQLSIAKKLGGGLEQMRQWIGGGK